MYTRLGLNRFSFKRIHPLTNITVSVCVCVSVGGTYVEHRDKSRKISPQGWPGHTCEGERKVIVGEIYLDFDILFWKQELLVSSSVRGLRLFDSDREGSVWPDHWVFLPFLANLAKIRVQRKEENAEERSAHHILERPFHFFVADGQFCRKGNLEVRLFLIWQLLRDSQFRKFWMVPSLNFTWSTSPCLTNLAFGLSDQYTCTCGQLVNTQLLL